MIETLFVPMRQFSGDACQREVLPCCTHLDNVSNTKPGPMKKLPVN
jgi:hypothetical protein